MGGGNGALWDHPHTCQKQATIKKLSPEQHQSLLETSTTTHQQVKTATHAHLNILRACDQIWYLTSKKKKKRQKRKSILKTDLKWNFWKSDYVALKVSCAPQIVVLGLSSLPQGSSLGKTDSSSHKHRLMPVALPSWKKPHENSPIHTWHVTWYSYVLVWFRKPYCCDFLVHTWFPSYMEDTCIADIPAQSSDS